MAAFGVSEDPVDDEAATFDAVRLVFKGDADGLQALLDKKPNAAKGHDDTFNDATALHVAVGETQPACARAPQRGRRHERGRRPSAPLQGRRTARAC